MSKRKPTAPIASDQWRSVDEHEHPEAAREAVVREFPDGASELEGASRREFMQLVGGTLALAGVGTLAGCQDPPENILPYNLKPADVTPGKPLHYATLLTHGGYATGVLATAWEGRPDQDRGQPRSSGQPGIDLVVRSSIGAVALRRQPRPGNQAPRHGQELE